MRKCITETRNRLHFLCRVILKGNHELLQLSTAKFEPLFMSLLRWRRLLPISGLRRIIGIARWWWLTVACGRLLSISLLLIPYLIIIYKRLKSHFNLKLANLVEGNQDSRLVAALARSIQLDYSLLEEAVVHSKLEVPADCIEPEAA